MAGVAHGRLARAVSEVGGLGMIGVGSSDAVEMIERESAIASDEGRLAFGIGLMGWALGKRPELLRATIAARPSMVSVSFGLLKPHVEELHEAGIQVASQVQNLASAIEATDAGVDLIVAQGSEAGGHTGTVATLPLLQILLDNLNVPVLAAGGIASARGVAAVLAAGAAGAWLGTALLASPETEATSGARARILAATENDTVLTKVFDIAQGIPWPEPFAGRALRNRFTDLWDDRRAELAGDPTAELALSSARAAGDFDVAYVYAGQAVGLVHEARPATEVVRTLGIDAERLLRARLARLADEEPVTPATAASPLGHSAVTDFAAQLAATSGDAIVIADPEGRILVWNSGAEAMFGYAADEAVGRTLDLIIPDKLRARHWQGYHETMRTGVTRYAKDLLAVPGVHQDGTRLSLEFTVALLGNEGGPPQAIGAIIRDVTERWNAERKRTAELALLRRQVGGGDDGWAPEGA